jgi:uncharacterized protein YbaR (Trm112 family)
MWPFKTNIASLIAQLEGPDKKAVEAAERLLHCPLDARALPVLKRRISATGQPFVITDASNNIHAAFARLLLAWGTKECLDICLQALVTPGAPYCAGTLYNGICGKFSNSDVRSLWICLKDSRPVSVYLGQRSNNGAGATEIKLTLPSDYDPNRAKNRAVAAMPGSAVYASIDSLFDSSGRPIKTQDLTIAELRTLAALTYSDGTAMHPATENIWWGNYRITCSEVFAELTRRSQRTDAPNVRNHHQLDERLRLMVLSEPVAGVSPAENGTDFDSSTIRFKKTVTEVLSDFTIEITAAIVCPNCQQTFTIEKSQKIQGSVGGRIACPSCNNSLRLGTTAPVTEADSTLLISVATTNPTEQRRPVLKVTRVILKRRQG